MALTDKNIVITPNIGQSADPKIVFSGASATTSSQNITMTVYPINSGTLSIEGSAGQLFSITNDLSGKIFSVNDVSGMPSIDVDANGDIRLAPFSGNVTVGGQFTGATIRAYKEYAYTNNSVSGTVNLDLSSANIFNLTLTGATTLTFSNTATSGIAYTMTIIARQDAGGSKTITWPASVKWPNSSQPVLSTGANKVDILNLFTVDGGATYYGGLALANIG